MMTRSLTLSLFIFILLNVLTHHVVHSYCVLNKMEDGTQVKVLQTGGQSMDGQGIGRPFYHTMSPGSKECCNFQNGDCNTTQERNSNVTMDVSFQ
ncbi:hypothetical protein BDC45DRAFT_493362 [Circinella umbellata]|nr:hypothetical protein BDC45DRAFT_493362 [Circinella umbellata]